MLENATPMRSHLTHARGPDGKRILSPGEARIAAYMLALRDAGRSLADTIEAAHISRAYGQRVARKAKIEFPDYTPRKAKEAK